MLGVPALGAYTESPGFDYDYATAGIGSYYEKPGFNYRSATAGLGMLYRYGAALGTWTGKPSEDPRMVKQFTTIRSTYNVRGLGGERTASQAADVVLAKARSLFAGNTVRKIGTTGWIAGGRVGYEVILAAPMRAGEIKRKNFQAGQQAAAQMGGPVRFTDARTVIPSNAFQDSSPSAPSTPEQSSSAATEEEQAAELAPQTGEGDSFLTRKAAGLPVWAWGLVGVGVVGGVVAFAATRDKPQELRLNSRRRG
jgi:hypothetical protein